LTGVDMFCPLLSEIVSETDANPVSFYADNGGALCPQTRVIGSHSALTMCVHAG